MFRLELLINSTFLPFLPLPSSICSHVFHETRVILPLQSSTDLVSNVEKTGLWPTKFQPALVTLDELHDIAAQERAGLRQQFAGAGGPDFIDQVRDKTVVSFG